MVYETDRCKEIIRSMGLSAPCAFRASVSSGLPLGLFLFPEDVLKKGKSYDWIPLWIDKWLMGSTRFELDPSERSVFIDLMVLAAKDDGFIRANAGMGYPHEWLSRSLNIPLEVLEKAIEKCIECEKIIDKGKGIYFIANWDSYRLSGSYKRAVTLGIKPMPGSKETVSVSEETDTVSPSMYMYKYKSPFKSKSKSKSSSFSGLGTLGVLGKWNSFAELHGLAEITEIEKGSSREIHLRKLSKKKGFNFDSLLEIMGRSPFLLGEVESKIGGKRFFATFDWVINKTNYQKIIEGNYIDREAEEIKKLRKEREDWVNEEEGGKNGKDDKENF